MILEKEDWEEPECCFRPHIAAAEAVHTGSADGGPSVREVIQGFDRLLDRDAKREAAIYLEDWMARYEEAGDWASQITICLLYTSRPGHTGTGSSMPVRERRRSFM